MDASFSAILKSWCSNMLITCSHSLKQTQSKISPMCSCFKRLLLHHLWVKYCTATFHIFQNLNDDDRVAVWIWGRHSWGDWMNGGVQYITSQIPVLLLANATIGNNTARAGWSSGQVTRVVTQDLAGCWRCWLLLWESWLTQIIRVPLGLSRISKIVASRRRWCPRAASGPTHGPIIIIA